MMQLSGILGVVIVIMGIAFGGYFYWSQGQFEDLYKQNADLTTSVNETKERIENITALNQAIAENIAAMSQSFNQIATDSQESVRILRSHDLDNIIENRPKVFENIINKGTSTRFEEHKNMTLPDNYAPTLKRDTDENDSE